MNDEFINKVNDYLRRGEYEKALSLLQRYKEDSAEYKQMENICLSKISNQYLSQIKEHIQNGEIQNAKDLVLKHNELYGTNPEIDQLNVELSKPLYMLKLQFWANWGLNKLHKMTITSAIKLFLLCMIVYILLCMGWMFLGVTYFYLTAEEAQQIFIPFSLLIWCIYLTFNYIIQYRIVQRRLLEDKYHWIEIVGILIVGTAIVPLFLLYLYLFGYPIWKKTILIGIIAYVCIFVAFIVNPLVIIGFILLITYYIMLYKTAKRYNM